MTILNRQRREDLIARTAKLPTRLRKCPACHREVHVTFDGLILQHTDPATWGEKTPRQCRAEFTNIEAAK